MTFKAKKARGKYKNQDSYLDAVYRNNKAFIDDRLRPDPNVRTYGKKFTPKQVFKLEVKSRMKDGMTMSKAIQATRNSTFFTSYSERSRANAWTSIKKESEIYKTLRKEIGWSKKIDSSLLKWDEEKQMYVYDKRITVDFSNSPMQIQLGRLEDTGTLSFDNEPIFRHILIN